MKKKITLDRFLGRDKEYEREEIMETVPELPKGWKWIRLGNERFFRIETGSTPRTDVKEYWDGNIKWATPRDLGRIDGKYIFATERKITQKGLESCSAKIVPKGSIIISTRAPIGHISIAGDDMCFNQGCKAVIIEKPDQVLTDFVYYALLTKVKEMIALGSGATFKEISKKKLYTISIPMPFSNGRPDIKEQKRIVARIEEILSRVDKAKKLKARARKDTEAIMQAALHKVFSKAEEKGWKWVTLESVARVVGGHTPKRNVPEYWNGDIPWLVPTELPSDNITIILDSKEKITQEGLKNSSAILLPPGTVLYTTRATIGKVAIAGVSLATNQGFTNFICTSRVYNWYLAYCLKWLTPLIQKEAGQTTFLEVKRSRLRKFKIPLPPLEEQKRIVTHLKTVSRITESLRRLQQITEKELEQFVPAILDKAFKGRL